MKINDLRIVRSYTLPLLLSVFALMQCTSPEQSSPEEKHAKPDRNMGGIGVPRGLIKSESGLSDVYVSYEEPNSVRTMLINRQGQVVHQWKGIRECLMSYLTDSGSVVRNVLDPDMSFPFFGGNAGRLEEISWQGDIVWTFEYSNEKVLSHHDLALLPYGNILIIAIEAKSEEECLAAGRKPEFTPKSGLWADMVIEIEPTKPRGAKIVWEWHSWDHLIQDVDPNLANYGDPSEHPELALALYAC